MSGACCVCCVLCVMCVRCVVCVVCVACGVCGVCCVLCLHEQDAIYGGVFDVLACLLACHTLFLLARLPACLCICLLQPAAAIVSQQ